MKPGSLIVMLRFSRLNALGVIIRKSSYKDIGVFDSKSESEMFTSVWRPHQWWDVWIGNKIIVESENYLKLI